MLPTALDRPFGARFLLEPDLFPGRIGGERWGDESVVVDLAGGPYRLNGLDRPMRAALERRLEPRCLPSATDALAITLFRLPAAEFVEFGATERETAFDLDHAADGVRIAGERFVARLDRLESGAGSGAWPLAGLWMAPPANEAELLGTIENLLRIVVAYRVAAEGGALLHSAGVLVDGRAWIFPGRSGAGKSTLSRLSVAAGLELLSDELNALWRDGEQVVVERMPFAGELSQSAGRRERFPLAAIHTLRQGAAHRRSAVSKGALLAEVVAAAPFLNVDPLRSERLLGNLAAILEVAASGELTFALDAGFWDLLRDAA